MAAAVAVDPATAMAPTSPGVPGRGTTDPDTLFARLSTTSIDEEMSRTLTGDVESLQRTADRQMTKLTTLNTSLNKKLRKLEADAAHLGGENANLRRAYINLLAELRASQAAAAELAAKEAELATVTSNYDGVRRTVKELKSRLKRSIAEGKEVQAAKESAEAQLVEINTANEVKERQAGEELMAAAVARTALERDLEAAKTEATERSVALEVTAEEKGRLESEVASLSEQISALNVSLEEARRDAEEVQMAKQDAEAKLGAAQGRVDELDVELKEVRELHASVEESVNDLMTQVQEAQAATAAAQEEVESTKKELDRSDAATQAAESARADLADELEAVTAAKTELESQLTAANTAMAAATATTAKVESEKEEVSRSLASTTADKSGLEAELARLRREMQNMKDAHESAMLALIEAKEDEKAQLLAALERDVTGVIDKQKGEVDESRRTSVARLSAAETPAGAASVAHAVDVDAEGGALQSGAGPRVSMASSAGQSDYTEGTYEEEPVSMPMGADTMDESEGATTPRTSTVSRAFDGAKGMDEEKDEQEGKAADAGAPAVTFATETVGDATITTATAVAVASVEESDEEEEDESEVEDEDEELEEGETAPAMVPVAADGGAIAARDAASDDEAGATGAPDTATTDDLAAVEAELAEEGVRTAVQAEAEMTAEAALQAVSSEPIISPVTGVQITGEQPGSPSSVVVIPPGEAAAQGAVSGTSRGIDDAADAIAAKKKKEAEAIKAADKEATKGGSRASAGTDKTKATSDATTAEGAREGSSGGRLTVFFKSCGCFSSE
ncbi:hypothetical protein MMPV_009052 [Pyropia vietnamensis]